MPRKEWSPSNTYIRPVWFRRESSTRYSRAVLHCQIAPNPDTTTWAEIGQLNWKMFANRVLWKKNAGATAPAMNSNTTRNLCTATYRTLCLSMWLLIRLVQVLVLVPDPTRYLNPSPNYVFYHAVKKMSINTYFIGTFTNSFNVILTCIFF